MQQKRYFSVENKNIKGNIMIREATQTDTLKLEDIFYN